MSSVEIVACVRIYLVLVLAAIITLAHAHRSEDNVPKLVLSPHYGGPEDQMQVSPA